MTTHRYADWTGPTLAAPPLDPVQERVFLDRYALKDADGRPLERAPAEMWRRVATAIAAVEPTSALQQTWAARFEAALRDFTFVPAGRILSGAGTGSAVTLFNCFVLPSPEDSRAGILENLKLAVEIMARGGGFGVNLSSLRPRGSHIRSVNGTSSGPCAWAELYSVATGEVIQQGGSRRGAAMLMLNDSHPDIEEFITVKTDLGRLLHANLSVCISDAFMQAVQDDTDWPLVWQGMVTKVVKARALWDRICEAAWRSAEPGLVFIDRVNALNNLAYCETIAAVNPCVTGETLISTAEGLIPARELAERGRPVQIVSPSAGGVRLRPASRVIRTGVRPVYRLSTVEGYTLRLTADHRVLTPGGWKAASDLVPGDRLCLANGIGGFGARGSLIVGRVFGQLAAEGYLRDGRALPPRRADATPGRELRRGVSALVARHSRGAGPGGSQGPAGWRVRDWLDRGRSSGRRSVEDDTLRVPPGVERGSRDMQVGFLQGLLGVGGRIGEGSDGICVRLMVPGRPLLEGAQRLLLNLGIAARIEGGSPPPGRPQRRGMRAEPHRIAPELVIAGANVQAFAERVGFATSREQEALSARLASGATADAREEYLATFASLEPDGEAEVYDLTEPVAHRFVANGLVVHNCGEQPLAAWNVCNLGALNLAAFVHDGRLDRAALAAHTRVAVRFLDDVIDATAYFFPENEAAQRAVRRVGLGTMGLADALIALRVRYGSDESLAVIEQIYRTIRDTAYDASADLAAEKGPFPRFDRDRLLERPGVRRLPEAIRAKMAAHGIRNGTLTCQAPTGTTSLLAGVSSGIEPIFDFRTIRRDRLGEHAIVHPAYQAWREAHPGAPLPPHFVTAGELSPEEHVRVQATIQEYTDAAIAKTTNAPTTHTVEDVKELYRLAYELGCKGITYYRDGSRPAVLSHADAEPEAASAGLRRRPRALAGTTYRAETPLGTAFITVNRNDHGEPFEAFISVGKAGSDTMAVAEALGRLISLILRLSSPLAPIDRVKEIVGQLADIGGGRPLGFGAKRVRSLPDAVARVLAEATELERGDVPITEAPRSAGDLCPACGEATLLHREGCRSCPCGYSEC